MLKLLPVYRVTVFVPAAHARRVIDGVCAIDDLRIGDYAEVVWSSAPGSEQFLPLPGANPASGAIGERVEASSVRIEFCIPRDEVRLRRLIVEGIRAHHPWQVPAIFVDESGLPLP